MAIQLTPEQERRVQDVISRGAYESVEEVVDAAWAAVEQRTVPGFAGTPDELDFLLAEGLASKELTEDEFWGSVNAQTNALLSEYDRPLQAARKSSIGNRATHGTVKLQAAHFCSTQLEIAPWEGNGPAMGSALSSRWHSSRQLPWWHPPAAAR
jgi:Arc/MetJ-type ribon-helix-helix transcriptional regulator